MVFAQNRFQKHFSNQTPLFFNDCSILCIKVSFSANLHQFFYVSWGHSESFAEVHGVISQVSLQLWCDKDNTSSSFILLLIQNFSMSFLNSWSLSLRKHSGIPWAEKIQARSFFIHLLLLVSRETSQWKHKKNIH